MPEIFCPQCDSEDAAYLGDLGILDWFRCRACGWDFSVDRPCPTCDGDAAPEVEPLGEADTYLCHPTPGGGI